LISYPYWLFFEWFAPIFEAIGYLYVLILIITGNLNWDFYLLLFVFTYTFAVALSTYAILYEEISYHRYNKFSDILKILLTAILEPFVYHPLTVIWSIKGNISFLKGNKSWGKMERKGFSSAKKV